MNPAPSPPTAFIGCDVGKATIAVFDSRSARSTVIANRPEALARFAATLDGSCLVICETTGGYEAQLLDALAQAGRAVHRADARRVKAFIRSLGRLGKSAAIDARALARYGQERHTGLARWQPVSAERDRLHALVMTRRDLVAARTAWSNRLAAPGGEQAAKFLDAVIGCIETQLAVIDADIATLIEASEQLARRVRCLRGISGIGARTAAALVALMPELGSLDRRQCAALAGLAPHPQQSGQRDGYRRVHGGRPEIKRVLFMAAMSAVRYHPRLRDFYCRLRQNGKKPLVALVAAMRKLIVICNATLRANAM